VVGFESTAGSDGSQGVLEVGYEGFVGEGSVEFVVEFGGYHAEVGFGLTAVFEALGG
jgi:hypothetical protein